MNAKEFALLNVNKEVYITEPTAVPRVGVHYGRVIGYYLSLPGHMYAEKVLLEPSHKDAGWTLRGNITKQTILLVNDATNGFYVEVKYLEAIKNIKPSIAYPHMCDKCKHIARKFKSFTICSNDQCKSRKNMKYELSKFPKPPSSLDGANYIICPMCKCIASKHVSNGIHAHTKLFQCGNGHRWEHICEPGHKIKNGVITSTWTHRGWHYTHF
jgi:hypothetical protein